MPRSATPSIRLRPEMNEALAEYADQANMPRTALMRLLLARGLDDIEEHGLGTIVADAIDNRERAREEREEIEV